ncbi:Os02g0623766, partial [Oryza sativa Japonica Group]
MLRWLIWDRISISLPNSFFCRSVASRHRLMATTAPLSLAMVPLYTVPFPPLPITLRSSNRFVACSSSSWVKSANDRPCLDFISSNSSSPPCCLKCSLLILASLLFAWIMYTHDANIGDAYAWITNGDLPSELGLVIPACAVVSVAYRLVRASAGESSGSVDTCARNGARVPEPALLTLAAVEEVGVAVVAGGAVAEVAAATAVPGVDALAVGADAGVGRRVPLGLLARLVPDGPVEHQRQLAAVGRHELVGGDVRGAEVERRGFDQHGVAAAAEPGDRRRVELLLEGDLVPVEAGRDGRLAAPHAGAGAVLLLQPARAGAHGHAPGHVPVGTGGAVGREDVGEGVAPDDGEAVERVVDAEVGDGHVVPPVALPVHGGRAAVVAPRVDGAVDAQLPPPHRHVHHLDLVVVHPQPPVRAAVAAQHERPVPGLEVAPAADAERVRDLHVAAPPQARLARLHRRRRLTRRQG